MKSITHFLYVCILCAAFNISSLAQTHVTGLSENTGRMITTQPDSYGWTDPAMDHNKLLQNQGLYTIIGTFKVAGSPYFFGEHNQADMFVPEAKAYNIFVSYNTYNQEVEFYSNSNPEKPLTREPGTADSFLIHTNLEVGIIHPLKFVYGSLLGSSEKAYFLELYAGKRYSVYKRYKSDLGYVSTNYVQSELRQFNLLYDYYYSDSAKPGLKKLKTNASSIISELKKIKDISPAFTSNDFTIDQEAALRKAFEYLNQ